MIDGIKNCAYSICAAAIFGSIMYYLLPEGSLSRLYKIVFGVFFLCCIVSPVMNSDIFDADWETELFDDNGEVSADFLGGVYSKTENDAEEKMVAETSKILDSGGVIYTNIVAEINISESGGINIERFEVVSEEPFGERIAAEIKNRVGAAPNWSGAG